MNSLAEEGSLVSLEDQSGSARSASYRVLARKYRPSTFDDLIGQDALVRTISNAFEAGRIPQAWILTGVRGVGKTTTARILARALNYEVPGRASGPSIQMPELGLHCQAIMDSRHIDVIEMDAASHNGVDDVRQINDAVRYAPVMARTKVYILDEVHMLSGAAFNALLKTLEEPPPHAKFIFATTEIRKVPVTVLSRCQRFDLRRVEASVLVKHLEMICARESVSAEPQALAVIARASEGSVRDSLSLLDQAIAHAAGPINAEDVHQMLGLADRTRIVGLFEALMQGNVAHALAELRDQYESGADPSVLLSELAEFTHFVTRVKIIPSVAEDPALVEVERVKGREFAAKLSVRVLSRAWQILFKGLAEVQAAARPVAAAEMVLIRLAYAADLPTPDEVIRQLDGGVTSRPAPAARPAREESAPTRPPLRSAIGGSASPSPAPNEAIETQSLTPFRFEDVVALAAEKRDLNLKRALESDVRLVRCENGLLELALEPGAERSLIHDLSRKLSEWTGRRWMVIVSAEAGVPTLKAIADAERASLMHGVQTDPAIQAVLARFPGAQIVDVRNRGGAALDANAPYGPSDAKKLTDQNFTDQNFTDQNFTDNGEGAGEDEA